LFAIPLELGELNDDFDVVELPFECLFEILRLLTTRDQTAEPLAVSARQDISGLVPVPLVGVDAAHNDVVLQDCGRRDVRKGQGRDAALSDAGQANKNAR